MSTVLMIVGEARFASMLESQSADYLTGFDC
jgi:hypothetical protein